MVSAPVNSALLAEIEQKAASKVSFGSSDPDYNFRQVMQMKMLLDSAAKNN